MSHTFTYSLFSCSSTKQKRVKTDDRDLFLWVNNIVIICLTFLVRINVAFMRHNVFIHVLCLLLILRRLKRSNLIETRTPNCIFIVFTHSFLMVRGFEIFNCSTCVRIFAPLSIVSELRVTL